MLNIDERYTLEDTYALHIVDGMDMDTLIQFAYEKIKENLETMSEEELIENVQEYAPHLLDDNDIESDGQPDELTEWNDFDPDC
jgi:hypothetical protein